jgi:alpha-beta hydrolase superfamily lysophospholipase
VFGVGADWQLIAQTNFARSSPMLKKSLRWMWQHRKLTVSVFLAAALILINIVAYNHAYAMTHFRDGGAKTGNPETLSFAEKMHALVLGVNIPRPVNQKTPESLGLPFMTELFQGTDGKLESWRIEHPRSKGTVLLVHGYANCKASLLQEAKAFHELGYEAVLLDLRGSGGSDGNETTVGIREADDVAAAAQALQEATSKRPLILYGQSMGSAAILRAIAQSKVQPNAVIIECPFDRLLSTVESRFTAMGVPSFPSARLLVFWGGVQHGFNGFEHNPMDYARSVRCPVLLMHGRHDPRVTQEQAQAIYENLAGEKRFELFPDAGHQPCLSANPKLWRQTVAEFLAER